MARSLSKMKPTAYLINTSRGPVVDEAALVYALESKKIAGAALDVYEKEPFIHSGLKRPNVVLAPHIASASMETRTKMAVIAAENVVAFFKGKKPANMLNPEAWKRVERGDFIRRDVSARCEWLRSSSESSFYGGIEAAGPPDFSRNISGD